MFPTPGNRGDKSRGLFEPWGAGTDRGQGMHARTSSLKFWRYGRRPKGAAPKSNVPPTGNRHERCLSFGRRLFSRTVHR